MASLNPQSNNNNNDNVDSDNDTQMSTQDNNNSNNQNDTNNQCDADDPSKNIDNDNMNTDNMNADNNTNNTHTTNNNNNNNDNDNKNDNDITIDDNDNKNDTNDSKTNVNNNNNNNNNNPSQPQYKYSWQWLENDNKWHDYDATTQLMLDQLTIGQKITISAGRFTYDITKVSNDSCTQLNTQTNNSRNSRRAKILIVPPPTNTNTNTNNCSANSNGYIGTGQYVFMWQYLENDNKWKDLSYNIGSQLENLALNGMVKHTFGKWTYTVNKISNDECTQTNDNTQNQRDLRRILFDTINNQRIVWQFVNDKGGWSCIDSNDLMLKLVTLQIGQIINHKRGQWIYNITKIDATNATQKNTNTNKIRQYKMIMKNKDEMDNNWISKAQTNNQNYTAGYKNTVNNANLQNYTFSNRWGGLFANLGGNDNDDDKPKEIIKLDPNDIQDIIMGDDIDLVMGNDNSNNTNNNNDDNDNDNDNDDDEKKEDKSERVLMSNDDKNIFDEFKKTLTNDCVEVISIQKIKENASKKIVYSALLSAKKDELKNKNGIDINKIERVLFHGTSFSNIAKIVNNGFNRDFNRHHLYGKGTYFSSLASESAKYCENDDENDNEKNVMLVCKVIIGEYCIGTHRMDGSSIPYKPDKKTQYESCVNNLQSPTIFVINRDYHAIPTHIITFKYKK